MTVLTQQLINGLTLGSIYALVALGYTMIFGVLELIAFAQGGVYMVGAYVGLAVASGALAGNPVVTLAATLVTAAGAGAIINMLIDRVGYRPIRGAKRLIPLISGIGIYMFLENGVGVAIGKEPRPYPALLPQGSLQFAGLVVTKAQITVAVIAVICMIALYLIVQRTRTGLAMRAVAERPATAGLMGIESERVIILTFALGGALSAVAGVLVGTYVGVATPTMGFLIGVKAFAAAVIGGIGSIPGAMVGALSVGVVESLGAGYISSAWGDAIVFAALILVLVVRPSGFFGAAHVEKV